MNSQIKANHSRRRFYQACLVGLSSLATLSALALVNPPQSYVLADTSVSSITQPLEASSPEIPVPSVTRTIQAVDPDGNVLHQTIQQAQSDPLRKGQPAWPDYIIPRIEGYHPANNQAQEVMSKAIDANTKDETVRVKYKKGDGEAKPGEVTSINFAWVWFDADGQQHTAFYPNKFSPVGIDAPAPSAPKNARIVTKLPKTFHIYPGSGVTYQLRIAPDGIQPQTRTVTRTIDLKLPDGTHQVKKQSLTFHQDLRFNEEPAGFELTKWLPESGWSFDEFQLPKFDGYTCGQKVVSKYELTPAVLDQEGTAPELNVVLTYQPINDEKPNKTTPEEKPDKTTPKDPDQTDSDKKDSSKTGKPSKSDDSTQTKKDDQQDPKPETDNSKKTDQSSQTDTPSQQDHQTQTDDNSAKTTDQGTQTAHSSTVDDGTQTDPNSKKHDQETDHQADQPQQNDQIKLPDALKPGDKTDNSESKHQETPDQPVPDNHQQTIPNDHKPSPKPQQTDQLKEPASNNHHQDVPKQDHQDLDRLTPTSDQSTDTASNQQDQRSASKENRPAVTEQERTAGNKSDDGSGQEAGPKANDDSKDVPNDQPVAASGVSGANQTLPQTGNSSNLATFVSLLATVLLGWLGLRSFKENDHQPK